MPEAPLDPQRIDHGDRDRRTRGLARLARPMALGAVIGAALAVAVYAIATLTGIRISRGLALVIWTGLIGLIGPLIAERLIAAHPRWFESGFDRDDASRP